MKSINKCFLILAALTGLNSVAYAQSQETAIFAGGCFWCMEKDFESVEGVISVVSGYTDGMIQKPTYKQVSAGKTGHTEAVKVVYDADKISYQQLLTIYWYSIDPFVKDRQFCDKGSQYRSGIYYLNSEQRKSAQQSKQWLIKKHNLLDNIHTEIKAASAFWEAEKYHQDYYKKNPLRYKFYRFNCGRDKRLAELWGDSAGFGAHSNLVP